MFKKFSSLDKPVKIAIISTIVGIILILTIFGLIYLPTITGFFAGLLESVYAFIYGFVFAFLLNPIYKKIHRYVFKFVENKKPHPVLRKAFSLILTYLIALIFIVLLFALIIPNVIQGLEGFNLNDFLDKLETEIVALLDKLPFINNPQETFDQFINGLFGDVVNTGGAASGDAIADSSLSSGASAGNLVADPELGDGSVSVNFGGAVGSILDSIVNVTSSVITHVFAIIVGIILSVYFLIHKEFIIVRAKRLLAAMFSEKNYNRIMNFANYTNNTFGRYIIGAVADSILVGIVIGLVSWICGFPMPALIGLVCGVTNIIPFFGPFLGSIPCGALILVITGDIWQVVLFAVIILVIQQVDGNIIAPHIHSESTGLTPIGVIGATSIFAYLFGFIGMVIGVPLCAVICYVIDKLIEKSLRKKMLPTELEMYDVPDIYKDGKFLEAHKRLMDEAKGK